MLDAFHGLITAKDTIFTTLADYAKMPEGAAGIRNFIALTKIFATVDPETLDRISKSVIAAQRGASARREAAEPCGNSRAVPTAKTVAAAFRSSR